TAPTATRPGSASCSTAGGRCSCSAVPARGTRTPTAPAHCCSGLSACSSRAPADRRHRRRGGVAGGTVERDLEDLLDRIRENEVELALRLGGQLVEIVLVLGRQHHPLQARA